jgi:hypothetical protein
VLVFGCDAGVDHRRRDLGATMATFAKPENALKRAEGESLGFGSCVAEVMPAVVLSCYLLQAGFVRHPGHR